MLAFVRSVPAAVRWAALGAVLVVLAFFGGRCSASKTETTTTSSTSSSASTTTATSSSTATADAQSAASTVVQTVYQNQATLRQDRDTDCTEDFDANTGKLVRRRCVTKTSTTSSSTASGGSTASSSSSSSSSSTAHVDSSSVTSTSSSTITSTSTTTTTGGTGTFFSSNGLHLSLIGSLGLLSDMKPAHAPTYGAGLSKSLVGPVSIDVAAYMDKTLTASLGLDLSKDWSVSGGAAVRWTDFTKPFYGGAIERRILGPVWVGVWGYSDRSGGISASITLP